MMNPMLNTRKPRGRRGEALVARMRAQDSATDTPRRIPPSTIHVSPTGTIDAKRFTPLGAVSRRQPVRSLPPLGGMVSARFGN